jgi:uncharacterized membrane protein (DUF485 family)
MHKQAWFVFVMYAVYCAIIFAAAQVLTQPFIGAWSWLIPILGVLVAGWFMEDAIRVVRIDLAASLRRLIRSIARRRRM